MPQSRSITQISKKEGCLTHTSRSLSLITVSNTQEFASAIFTGWNMGIVGIGSQDPTPRLHLSVKGGTSRRGRLVGFEHCTSQSK
ncbi:hypothetical protein FA13DRAFT_1727513 [Coprinellus micaceus]|uniref:Uncharacterized protein n=1 Tax=Coprinellus micaceus TaxID=71717 RepID=A0A4Y7TPS7_COPMI|nr:hypothetical protein FA13DRAFT_1727513 [Coprinellus micaceus]